MTAYEWDSSLETGHDKIDLQHKQLIAAVNRLLDSCSEGKGTDELSNTLEFLNSYIIKHFSDEEKLMRFYKYADFERHRWYHEEFKKDVRELTSRLLAEGPSEMLIGRVSSAIVDWLLNHIKGDDFKFASSIAPVAEARR